jgi:hypothetical protein
MKYLLLIIVAVFANSCNMKRIDTTEMVEKMKDSEIKRITPTQISAFANEWGTEITNFLNKDKANLTLTDSLCKLYNATITNVNLLDIKLDTLDKKEAELIQAYQYNIANNQPINSNLQKLKEGEIQLFTAPIAGEKNHIWRVGFTKKQIIKRVSVKDIKKNVTK